jgi:hypothetical protein
MVSPNSLKRKKSQDFFKRQIKNESMHNLSRLSNIHVTLANTQPIVALTIDDRIMIHQI